MIDNKIMWDEGDLRYIRNYYSILNKTIKYWKNGRHRHWTNSFLYITRHHPKFLHLHHRDSCIRSYSLHNYLTKGLLLLLLKFCLECENAK